MKKLSLIGLIILSTLLTTYAQWSGGNPLLTNSNVGIGLGSITPDAPLEIKSLIPNRGLMIGRENLSTKISLHVAEGNYGYLDLGGYTQLRGNGLNSNFEGNVGIGTNQPNHKLQTDGNSTNGVHVIKAGSITNDFTSYGVSYPRQFGLGVMAGQGYIDNIPVTQPNWHGSYGGYIGGWFDVNSGNEFSTNISGVISVLRGTGSGNAYGIYSNLTKVTGTFIKFGIYTLGETYNYFSGSVGIGCTPSATTKLAVDGKINAKEVVVTATVPSSDYVFEKGYKLKSLTEVESFVNTNKHLPDVPSAKEFKEQGCNVGQMQDVLLKKVEELTLYIIEQNKIIDAQNEEIKQIKKQIYKNK